MIYNSKKNRFYKTNHFWKRAWDRGFNQAQINRLLKSATPPRGKSFLVFGKKKLAEAGIKLKNKSHLIIVAKDNVLITLFEVPDLFVYMKVNFKFCNLVIV